MKKESRVVDLPDSIIPLILEGDVFDNLKKIPDKSGNGTTGKVARELVIGG